MNSVHEILKKIINGETISDKVITKIYNDIINNHGDEYSNLLVIGRSCSTKYRSIIEEYLNNKKDPMLARLALQILCRYWGLGAEYLSEIKLFLKGVSWDFDDDVKLMAISCSPDAFKKKQDKELLDLLLNIFNDSKNEDKINRSAAYESLALISGVNILEIPSPARFQIKKDVDENVIKNIMNIQNSLKKSNK